MPECVVSLPLFTVVSTFHFRPTRSCCSSSSYCTFLSTSSLGLSTEAHTSRVCFTLSVVFSAACRRAGTWRRRRCPSTPCTSPAKAHSLWAHGTKDSATRALVLDLSSKTAGRGGGRSSHANRLNAGAARYGTEERMVAGTCRSERVNKTVNCQRGHRHFALSQTTAVARCTARARTSTGPA